MSGRPIISNLILAMGAACCVTGAAYAGDLAAAISPAARSVALPPGGTATATTFATVINRTDGALGNCEPELPGRFGALDLSYAWTNPADNSLIPGSENTPFSLGPRASQSLVLAISGTAAFDGIVPPVFECAGGANADTLYGINTLDLTISETAPTDILAIGIALPSNDGVIRIAEAGGRQAYAIAAINIGADGDVLVSPRGIFGQNAPLPADITICESGPDGRCLAPALSSLTVNFAQNGVRTFSVFVRADPDIGITLAPANTRVEVRFLVGDRLAAATSAAITAPGPQAQGDARDALRLAQQATFGPNQSVIDDIRRRGVEAWVDRQLTLTDSTYADIAAQTVNPNFCRGVPQPCGRDHFSAFPLQMRFFRNAMDNPDQLRQRVAFALSQILVVGENEVNTTYALGRYQQMLLENAFGNYRDILRGVALSPTMGDYLDMVNSRAEAPNENFPRELMQLFALGEGRLNPDGTPITDSQGRVLPAYTEADVVELSRALTGWVYPTRPGELPSVNNARYYDADMSVYAAEHDSASKIILGEGLVGGQGAAADLDEAIDILFEHPNVAPFISGQLIQHLVTSNPSPAYVGRISAVFENNGSGVRGDLGAVVRAILLDAEARTPNPDLNRVGKLREPVLLMVSTLRLIGAQSDGYVFLRRAGGMGQIPFESPSVFNFYPPDFALQGSDGLVSPSQGLVNMSSIYERHNVLYDWTYNGYSTRWDWRPLSSWPGATGTSVDWSSWGRLAQTPERLLDVLDDIALEEDLTAQQRALILDAMEEHTYWGNPLEEAQRRARLAIYLIVTSPSFQIDQ
jgi:uncharacterized protein (DUF1800 family)